MTKCEWNIYARFNTICDWHDGVWGEGVPLPYSLEEREEDSGDDEDFVPGLYLVDENGWYERITAPDQLDDLVCVGCLDDEDLSHTDTTYGAVCGCGRCGNCCRCAEEEDAEEEDAEEEDAEEEDAEEEDAEEEE